jgi:uncharacterized protein (DUF427 family)
MDHVQRIAPGPGQESVWDYPRPPRLEPANRHIQIIFNGELIADSHRAWRVLETTHPPVYYVPPEDILEGVLQPGEGRSLCEWKGQARYFTVQVGGRQAVNAAWSYPSPTPGFTAIQDYVAFYAGPMDRCLVDGEEVRPQPGSFYGGWITNDIVGPYKGEPGTHGW